MLGMVFEVTEWEELEDKEGWCEVESGAACIRAKLAGLGTTYIGTKLARLGIKTKTCIEVVGIVTKEGEWGIEWLLNRCVDLGVKRTNMFIKPQMNRYVHFVKIWFQAPKTFMLRCISK